MHSMKGLRSGYLLRCDHWLDTDRTQSDFLLKSGDFKFISRFNKSDALIQRKEICQTSCLFLSSEFPIARLKSLGLLKHTA